jgi:hypothetical protein
MVTSKATTVESYLAGLPEDRRAVVAAVRDALNAHMPAGYQESISYGMIGWSVPLSRYPDTYNGQPLGYVALAAQKSIYSLYLTGVYADGSQEKRLLAAYAELGRKPDMGKSCVRFRQIDHLPLTAICELVGSMSVDDYIAQYEASRAPR